MTSVCWPEGLGPVLCIVGARPNFMKMAPILRASWLRGVSALPNSFAHESWIDEAASAAAALAGRRTAAGRIR